jgi:chemosensory pili system protein ChpA (sensor histidine kinase/response regulator)
MAAKRGREPRAGRKTGTSAAAPERAESSRNDDFGESLEEVFAEELRECLQLVPPQLEMLRSPATQAVACDQLQRVFHTIKGSAGLVGLDDLARAALALERLFSRPEPIGPAALARAQSSFATLFEAAGLEAPAATVRAFDDASEATGGPELLEAFAVDASDALQRCEDLLLGLEESPADGAALADLFRQLHTLKGSAAAVGLSAVVASAHEAETAVESALAAAGGGDATTGLVEKLLAQVDRIKSLVAAALGEETEGEAAASGAAAAATGSAPQQENEIGVARVPTGVLDSLLEQVSQLVVNRVQMEQKIRSFADLREKLHSCRRRLEETAQLVDRRLEDRLWEESEPRVRRVDADDRFFTELEFDKYDDFTVLSRSVVEAASDAGEIAEEIGRLIERLGDQARHFSKLTTGLQQEISELRRIPIELTLRRLRRPVRDAARQAGKIVDLKFRGADVLLDRAVVEALHAPLLHLVRNAVAHGIEPPDVRAARGKMQIGSVVVSAAREPEGVRITVQDDGGGLDLEAIAARGRALGIPLEPGASREQLLGALFHQGFTTRAEASELCGRGVGLDAVARDVGALNGTVRIDFEAGRGTKVELLVPIHTSIDEALLVEVGSQLLGMSVRSVECAVPVEMSMVQGGATGSVSIQGAAVPVLILADLLDEPPPADAAVAVVVRAREGRLAVLVDRVRAQQDLAVRPPDAMLEGHPFVRGAAIAGTGAVVFLLDPAGLAAAAAARLRASRRAREEDAAFKEEASRAVLVVDDSISVRKLAARFLEGEGIEVETAVDGIDAIEKLTHDRFRVVVTDLEMPRLHGYQLIETMRRHPRWGRIPIIVCTSRSSEKHRAKAREMGAAGYVTKPFTREELVGEVLRLWSGDVAADVPAAQSWAPEGGDSSAVPAQDVGAPARWSGANGRS